MLKSRLPPEFCHPVVEGTGEPLVGSLALSLTDQIAYSQRGSEHHRQGIEVAQQQRQQHTVIRREEAYGSSQHRAETV
jgi:hypothetical protein